MNEELKNLMEESTELQLEIFKKMDASGIFDKYKFPRALNLNILYNHCEKLEEELQNEKDIKRYKSYREKLFIELEKEILKELPAAKK